MTAPPWPTDPLPELARLAARRPMVVLDDDPTGTQTLRHVSVLTEWDAQRVARHVDDAVLFLSTNSRALDADAAAAITRDAATAALAAGRAISLVSRSDSTLRGHFPVETTVVAGVMGRPDARVLLAPYFGEGGRVTVDDVHYLDRGGGRTPVADTEFARDTTFGYRSSNLRDWVAEKHVAAKLPIPPIASLSRELVRTGGPAGVAEMLGGLGPATVAIANAEVDRDIEVIALGALLAEERGVPMVARTAASYVRARAGRPHAPPLRPDELTTDGGAGIIVVGSHVPTTTGQLARLQASPIAPRLDALELSVAGIVGAPTNAAGVTVRAAAHLDRAVGRGRIGLVSTERTVRTAGLAGGARISAVLVEAVAGMRNRPGWVVAKGGITSFEIAKTAMGIREGRVIGQLLPGVPVWAGGADARWPGVPLVVFPGNIGEEDALVRAIEQLEGS
ncbi:MAG: hypothetical protein M3Y40_03810 [Chloroflexota bacterium]|nr:hypothetical protein [Chloroflexota bacterium]